MLSGSNAEIIPVIKDIVVSLTKTIEKSDEFFERLES